MMPFSPKIVGNPTLPAIHGGMDRLVSGDDRNRRRQPLAQSGRTTEADRIEDQLFALGPRTGQLR